MTGLIPLPPLLIEQLVRLALLEDLGRAGDITSAAVVPPSALAVMHLRARQPGVVAGLDTAAAAFRLLDPRLTFSTVAPDGSAVQPDSLLAVIKGPAASLLSAERVALNLLCRLSGIATATASLVQSVSGHKAAIVCTRKTTPGLRALEKYAVRAGGGANHRFGLDDAILIKDNHIALAGGVAPALKSARAAAGHLTKIELEVDTLDQLAEALKVGVDVVLLDNMSLEDLRAAVGLVGGRAIVEASGRITIQNASAVAATGVDFISVGWITHSAPALDIGLDFISSTG